MSQLAVTVIGPDRPGIIADVTEALVGTGVNLEDSTMTLLRGHFAMMIVCAGSFDVVESALEPLRGELVITVRTMGPEHRHAPLFMQSLSRQSARPSRSLSMPTLQFCSVGGGRHERLVAQSGSRQSTSTSWSSSMPFGQSSGVGLLHD